MFHGIDNLMSSALLEVKRLWYSWSATASEQVFVTESLYWMEVMAVRQAAVSASVKEVVFREMKGKSVRKIAPWGVCARVFVTYITKLSLSSFHLKTYSVFPFFSFFCITFRFLHPAERRWPHFKWVKLNDRMIIGGASNIKWMHLLIFFFLSKVFCSFPLVVLFSSY